MGSDKYAAHRDDPVLDTDPSAMTGMWADPLVGRAKVGEQARVDRAHGSEAEALEDAAMPLVHEVPHRGHHECRQGDFGEGLDTHDTRQYRGSIDPVIEQERLMGRIQLGFDD